MELTRKMKGNLAEAEAKVYFIRNGYEIYLPAFDNAKYDMLVAKDGEISRVSVKYCSAQHASGSWRVSMTNVSRRANNATQVDKFDSSLFDLVAVYIAPEDRLVVVAASESTPNILTIK